MSRRLRDRNPQSRNCAGWNTPPDVLDSVRRFGVIGLDPCANRMSTVNARVEWHLSRGQDGLRRSWQGYGLVFVNPPYGRRIIDPWVEKACREFFSPPRNDEVVLLVPARTSSPWFQNWCAVSDAICLWRGRIAFTGKGGKQAPFASALVYWGRRVARFRKTFEERGRVWVRGTL